MCTGEQLIRLSPLSSNAKGKVWGSDEVNVEGWKPLKRLPGHESGASSGLAQWSFLTFLRCHRPRLVAWRQVSRVCGIGLASSHLVRIYTR